MSLTASYAALAVMLVRLLIKKAPKIFSYVLWSIVLFRLVCPISFESPLSLIPGKTEAIPYNIAVFQNPTVIKGIETVDNTVNDPVQSSFPTVNAVAGPNSMDAVTEIASIIWLLGIAVLLGYGMMSYNRLKNRIFDATLVRDNIFETDRIETPFVLGLIKPRIYIPTGLASKELDYILKHEQTHIKRRDYVIKPIAFCAVVLHWFNPLMWFCYSLMSKDMEMSCDESVLKQSSEDIRINYSSSLLALSARASGLLSPLAFGESNVKSRIKNVLNYKKPAFWIIVVAVVLVAAAAVSLISNPIHKDETVSKAEQLLKNKTEYVGDAPKVGNIIAMLDYPDKVYYDHFELDTDSPPYEVTVYLKTDTAEEYFMNDVNEPYFMKNAIIMFSLISNVDYINFHLIDDRNDLLLQYPIMQYPRKWVDTVMGRDVREFSKGEEEFIQLLNMLENFPIDEGSSIGIVGGVDGPTETAIVANIPDEEIALSAIEREGMYQNFILQVRENKRPFDWKNVSNPTYAPQLLLNDINHDGQKELIVILTTATGSGVHITEAHIINPETLMETYIENPSAIIMNHVKTEITQDQVGIDIDNEKTVVDIGELDIEPENLFSEEYN
jgi:beta-lactamase regulating signal transducer with metallopeptidase domain